MCPVGKLRFPTGRAGAPGARTLARRSGASPHSAPAVPKASGQDSAHRAANNEAEQIPRIVRLRQKVSRCSRTAKGAC